MFINFLIGSWLHDKFKSVFRILSTLLDQSVGTYRNRKVTHISIVCVGEGLRKQKIAAFNPLNSYFLKLKVESFMKQILQFHKYFKNLNFCA